MIKGKIYELICQGKPLGHLEFGGLKKVSNREARGYTEEGINLKEDSYIVLIFNYPKGEGSYECLWENVLPKKDNKIELKSLNEGITLEHRVFEATCEIDFQESQIH